MFKTRLIQPLLVSSTKSLATDPICPTTYPDNLRTVNRSRLRGAR